MPFQRLKAFVRKVIGVQRLAVELEELRGRLDVVEAELWNLPHTAQGQSLILGEGASARFGYDQARSSDDSAYAGFEDVFRGTDAFVRGRLQQYLPLLPPASEVVDLGCGRGEMLQILAEAGHRAVGVDSDEGMVQRCLRSGHSAVLAEAGSYLQSVGAASLDVVFSAQFIEHIEPSALTELLAASHRALRPEGLFIAETVNPHCLSALRTFFVDLTHVKPIFPEGLLVMCREAGFSEAVILFPNGRNDFEWDRRHTGEYAVVASVGR